MSSSHSGFEASAAWQDLGGGSDILPPGPAGEGWLPPEDAGVPLPPPTVAARQPGHGLVGVARDVRFDVEHHPYGDQRPEKVLSVRIERFDESGNRLAPVQVQMRGPGFDGTIRDGDWIAVAAARQAGKTLVVNAVENLTTQTTVKVRRAGPPAWLAAIFVLVLIGFLAILGVVVYLLVTPPDPPFEVPPEGVLGTGLSWLPLP